MNPINITSPAEFGQQLDQIISKLYDFFEFTREDELLPVDKRGERFDKWKCLFEVSGQYARPLDYLQCLFDMLRVMYEPNPPGTFFLNANPDFIFEEIRSTSFELGYVTAISEADESIADFYGRVLVKRLIEYKYEAEYAFGIFVFITRGKHSQAQIGEALSFFQAGFSIDEALETLANKIKEDGISKRKRAYAGFATDEALGSRARISLWLFMPVRTPSIAEQCH